jgi:hypothetical protein
VTHRRRLLVAAFDGCQVALEVDADSLEAECRARLSHLLVSETGAASVSLRLALREFAPSCVELTDSEGRSSSGSIDYVMHHVRKWITAAFACAHPELLWLHAAAASRDGTAILLTGGAGAGKSTLVARLLEQGWRLVADDAAPLHPDRWTVSPLPFAPAVRQPADDCEPDAQAFLERRKAIVRIAPDEVARQPVPLVAIVFPHYDDDAAQASLTPLTAVAAAPLLAAQELFAGRIRIGRMREISRLAKAVPCWRLTYRDSTSAAAQLNASARYSTIN